MSLAGTVTKKAIGGTAKTLGNAGNMAVGGVKKLTDSVAKNTAQSKSSHGNRVAQADSLLESLDTTGVSKSTGLSY